MLVAEAPAGEFEEDGFEGGMFELDVGEFETALVDPFDEVDDGAGGLFRGDGEQSSIGVEYGGAGRRFVEREWKREADFDARGAEGIGDKVAGRADGDDAALVDDGDAVAEALGFFDVVGGEDDRALLVAEFENELVNFQADLGIEAGGGFVEEDQLGIVDHGHGEGEALLLAAGKRTVDSVAFFGKLKALEQSVGIDGFLIKRREEAHGFVEFDLVGKVGCLEADADAFFERAGVGGGVKAEHANIARSALTEAFEDFNGGCFAGSVGAEKSEDFAVFDGEIDAANGFDCAVVFLESGDLNAGFAHALFLGGDEAHIVPDGLQIFDGITADDAAVTPIGLTLHGLDIGVLEVAKHGWIGVEVVDMGERGVALDGGAGEAFAVFEDDGTDAAGAAKAKDLRAIGDFDGGRFGDVRTGGGAEAVETMADGAAGFAGEIEEEVSTVLEFGRDVDGFFDCGRGGAIGGRTGGDVDGGCGEALNIAGEVADIGIREAIAPGGHGGVGDTVADHFDEVVAIESAAAETGTAGGGTACAMAVADRAALGEEFVAAGDGRVWLGDQRVRG